MFAADRKELGGVLHAVSGAASKDQARPMLCAVALDREKDHVRFVATDSYQMTIVDTPYPYTGPAPESPLMIEGDDVSMMLTALRMRQEGKDAELSWDGAGFKLEVGSVTVTGRFFGGDYPDYRLLVKPTDGVCDEVAFNPRFLAGVARAVGGTDSTPVQFHAPDKLKPAHFTGHLKGSPDFPVTHLLMPVRMS